MTTGLLLIIKSIEVSVGLMFLGMILTVLYSMHLLHLRGFIRKTKFAKFRPLLMVSLSITLILTQFLPSMVYAGKEISSAAHRFAPEGSGRKKCLRLSRFFPIEEERAGNCWLISRPTIHRINSSGGRPSIFEVLMYLPSRRTLIRSPIL